MSGQQGEEIWRPVRFLPALGVMALIFVLSHQPGPRLPMPRFPGADKLAHFLIYGLLAATVVRGIPEQVRRERPWAAALGTALFCLLYGASDELHQYFVPQRSPSLADLLADGAGGLAAALMLVLL